MGKTCDLHEIIESNDSRNYNKMTNSCLLSSDESNFLLV